MCGHSDLVNDPAPATQGVSYMSQHRTEMLCCVYTPILAIVVKSNQYYHVLCVLEIHNGSICWTGKDNIYIYIFTSKHAVLSVLQQLLRISSEVVYILVCCCTLHIYSLSIFAWCVLSTIRLLGPLYIYMCVCFYHRPR